MKQILAKVAKFLFWGVRSGGGGVMDSGSVINRCPFNKKTIYFHFRSVHSTMMLETKSLPDLSNHITSSESVAISRSDRFIIDASFSP